MSNGTILYDADKLSKKLLKAFGILLGVVVLAALVFVGVFFYNISPVSSQNDTDIKFTIKQGWGKNTVIHELEAKDLIKSEFFAKLYLKINPSGDFLAGSYYLNKTMSLNDILKVITSADSIDNEQVTVRLIEGKRLADYARDLDDAFDFSYDDFMNKVNDKEYVKTLINKYWFLTDKVLDDKIYYPLEGYLFADTYSFKKNSSVEEVVTILLNGMKNKLEALGLNENSGVNIHELLTLASMTENEAKEADDRKLVAGVFKNRIKINMNLGSDVTTYYAAKKAFQQSLTQAELDECNAYNTRCKSYLGLPIGPICTPSYMSIEAAYKPTESDYLYFVADKYGKTYFAKTDAEHLQNINKLKSQGLWQ